MASYMYGAWTISVNSECEPRTVSASSNGTYVDGEATGPGLVLLLDRLREAVAFNHQLAEAVMVGVLGSIAKEDGRAAWVVVDELTMRAYRSEVEGAMDQIYPC